jgi:hypothetical protein
MAYLPRIYKSFSLAKLLKREMKKKHLQDYAVFFTPNNKLLYFRQGVFLPRTHTDINQTTKSYY